MTTVCRTPDTVIAVQTNMVDAAVGESRRIAPLYLIIIEARAIETVQAVPGGKPHHALAILSHTHHGILRQAIVKRIVRKHARLLLCTYLPQNPTKRGINSFKNEVFIEVD